MKIIYTKNLDEILVDDEDYEWAYFISWYLDKDGYVTHSCSKSERLIYKKKNLKLHCMILSCPAGKMIDHIHGNKKDNRKSELRICSNRENSWNSPIDKRNKSGYKGVSWDKSKNKWEVNITINGKRKFLKYSDDIIDAAKVYDKAAKDNFGEFAWTNFE